MIKSNVIITLNEKDFERFEIFCKLKGISKHVFFETALYLELIDNEKEIDKYIADTIRRGYK